MAEIKCPCGLRNHMEEEDCIKTNCNACCPLTKPQTNADKIRAMSDEELADLIDREISGCPPTGDCNKASDDCKACWLDWLKQSAEEGER